MTENLTLPTVLGVGGKLRSGKDAFADYLVENHGFQKLGMSDHIHAQYSKLNPIIEWVNAPRKGFFAPILSFFDKLFRKQSRTRYVRYNIIVADIGYTAAKAIPDIRQQLGTFGADIGRVIGGENVWTRLVGQDIERLRAEGHPVILTGVRFPNELDMIRDADGQLLWVTRPGYEPPVNPLTNHSTENSVSPEDFGQVVVNDGTLEDLYATARKIAGVNA